MPLWEESLVYALIGLVAAILPIVFILMLKLDCFQFSKQIESHCLVTSITGSPYVLLGYRLFIIFYAILAIISAFFLHGWNYFTYFTLWNYTLLTVYFVLAASLSMEYSIRYWKAGKYATQARRSASGQEFYNTEDEERDMINTEPREKSNDAKWMGSRFTYFAHLITWVLFNVEFAMSMLVDIMVWCLLFPASIEAGTESQFISFTSFSAHLFNFFFLLADFLLSNIPLRFYNYLFSLIWGISYIVFQVIYYYTSDLWVYPFLNTTANGALFWYLFLLFIIALFHVICYGIWRLKVWVYKKCFASYECADMKEFGGHYTESDYLRFR